MKKSILLFISTMASVLAVGFFFCTHNIDSSEDYTPPQRYTPPVTSNNTTTQQTTNTTQNIVNSQKSIDEGLIQKYSKEGFIDKNTFVILIMRPMNSTDSLEEIKSQAKNRTLASLQHYIQGNGKTLTPNINANLLNIINSNGSLKTVKDSANSRVLYVFEVSKPDLKLLVDSM